MSKNNSNDYWDKLKINEINRRLNNSFNVTKIFPLITSQNKILIFRKLLLQNSLGES